MGHQPFCDDTDEFSGPQPATPVPVFRVVDVEPDRAVFVGKHRELVLYIRK